MITTSLRESEEWIEVGSQDDWNVLDELIKGGDDGLIKDLRWSNQTYVDSGLQMVFDGEPYVTILFQLQNEPVTSVEMVVTGVQELILATKYDLIVSAKMRPDLAVLWLTGEGRSRVVGRKVFYRVPQNSRLGKGPFDIDVRDS